MSKKIIFRAVLAILILIFSFLTWYLVHTSLWRDGDDYVRRIVLPLISFLILGLSLGFWFLTLNEKKFLWLAPAMIFSSFLFVFSFSWLELTSPWNLTPFLILFFAILFFAWGIRNLKQEKEARFKIVLTSILRGGLKPAITAIIILASIGFYFSPLAQANLGEISFPRPFFDSIFNPLMEVFENDVLKNNAPNGAADSNNLPPEIKNQLAAQQKDVADQVFNLTNQIIANAGKPFKKFFPLGLTLSFFFALKIFEIVFLWLIIFIIWIFWKILRYFNVIKIKIMKVDKEEIEI